MYFTKNKILKCVISQNQRTITMKFIKARFLKPITRLARQFQVHFANQFQTSPFQMPQVLHWTNQCPKEMEFSIHVLIACFGFAIFGLSNNTSPYQLSPNVIRLKHQLLLHHKCFLVEDKYEAAEIEIKYLNSILPSMLAIHAIKTSLTPKSTIETITYKTTNKQVSALCSTSKLSINETMIPYLEEELQGPPLFFNNQRLEDMMFSQDEYFFLFFS